MTKQRTIDPLLLLGSIIVLAAMLTWVLPAGRFDRKTDPQTHRTVVVLGSYQFVARNPVGPWGTLVSIPQGLSEAAEVVIFVLLAGCALTVVWNRLGVYWRHLGRPQPNSRLSGEIKRGPTHWYTK